MSDVILGVTLKSTTGKLTTADQVFDKLSNKTQEQINQEIKTAVSGAYNFRGSVDTLLRIKEKVPLKVGDVFNLAAEFTLGGKKYPAGTNIAVLKAVNNQTELASESVFTQYFDPLGGTITGLVTSTELTNKGYQNASQVNTLIKNATNGKLLTDLQITAIDLINLGSSEYCKRLFTDIITLDNGTYSDESIKMLYAYVSLVGSRSDAEFPAADFIRAGKGVALISVLDHNPNTNSERFCFVHEGKYYECTLTLVSSPSNGESVLVSWQARGIAIKDIATLASKITAVESKANTNASNISSLTTRVGNVETKANSNANNINSQGSRISTLERSSTTLNSKVTALENNSTWYTLG